MDLQLETLIFLKLSILYNIPPSDRAISGIIPLTAGEYFRPFLQEFHLVDALSVRVFYAR